MNVCYIFNTVVIVLYYYILRYQTATTLLNVLYFYTVIS